MRAMLRVTWSGQCVRFQERTLVSIMSIEVSYNILTASYRLLAVGRKVGIVKLSGRVHVLYYSYHCLLWCISLPGHSPKTRSLSYAAVPTHKCLSKVRSFLPVLCDVSHTDAYIYRLYRQIERFVCILFCYRLRATGTCCARARACARMQRQQATTPLVILSYFVRYPRTSTYQVCTILY